MVTDATNKVITEETSKGIKEYWDAFTAKPEDLTPLAKDVSKPKPKPSVKDLPPPSTSFDAPPRPSVRTLLYA